MMSSSIPPDHDSSQSAAASGERYARPAVSSDELLPPVEPPSARFIIQLFVIPAVIVAAVVLLWMLIESLARGGAEDPDQIVAALRSSNQARFQRAKELADMLRLPQSYPELKTNRELAQKLAGLLGEQVEAADAAEAAVTMRIFLATALGEFHVADGLPVLMQAAASDAERDVRRRAVNAIAVLAGSMANLKPPQPLQSDELTEALLALADDRDELIRSETAFAIGVVAAPPEAHPRLTAKLKELADDPYTDARFNAAVGLARVGSPRAGAAIAEMFDFDSIASSVAGEKAMTPEVSDESLLKQKTFKRNSIIGNALSAAETWLEQPDLPDDSLQALEAALAKFIAEAPEVREPAPVPEEFVDYVQARLKRVKSRLDE